MSDRSQYALKKPDAILFQRNNSILPFEDASSLEFFSNKNDWSVPHPPWPTRLPAPALLHRPRWGIGHTAACSCWDRITRRGQTTLCSAASSTTTSWT